MRVAIAVMLCSLVQLTAAQKLTGNLTSGITCTPEANGLIGGGCPKDEGCCPTTNTCVKITSCSDYVRVCPPPTCGKDMSFSEVTCPAEATRAFKSPKNLKCLESRDTVCTTNGTAMAVACRSAAGAAHVHIMVIMLAALVSLALMLPL